MPPPDPNLNLNLPYSIQQIPPYTIRPSPSLLYSTQGISPTWKSTLLASIPPNLSKWFIPQDHEGHYEIYKPPSPDDLGKWRFSYRTALALILDSFNEDFLAEFRKVLGIELRGKEKVIDLMELIGALEEFIERVNVLPTSSSHIGDS
jgi:hypothetical protein